MGLDEEAWEAFFEAAPYLCNLEWAREAIARCLAKSGSYEELEEALIRMAEEAEDRTKETDVEIFLQRLRARVGLR